MLGQMPARMVPTGSLAPGELSVAGAPASSLADVARRITALLSDRLGLPTALLSRTGSVWRFEAEAWPERPNREDAPAPAPWRQVAFGSDDDHRDPDWTAVTVGGRDQARSWVVLLPGAPDVWEDTPVVSRFVPDIGALLEEAAERDDAGDWKRLAQRYHRFCRRLSRAESSEHLYALVLHGLARQVRAEVGALALYSEADRRLSIVKTLGYPHELVEHLRIGAGEGVIGSVFSTGRATLGTRRADDHSRRLRYRTNSYAAVPLVGPGGVLGVAAFTDPQASTEFSAADLSALRLLAGPAALALTNQKLRQAADEITRLASIDPLTGLFNRRYFDTRLEAELQRSRRSGEPLTLLMLDIDNFKTINDEHGHVVGDRLLRCVSDRLRRGVRIFDVCARYGGDEFAILMPASNVDTAVLVAERIRASVRGHCGHESHSVTVSIGIAHSDGRERELLSIADRALLEAKAMGKNAVRVQGRIS